MAVGKTTLPLPHAQLHEGARYPFNGAFRSELEVEPRRAPAHLVEEIRFPEAAQVTSESTFPKFAC